MRCVFCVFCARARARARPLFNRHGRGHIGQVFAGEHARGHQVGLKNEETTHIYSGYEILITTIYNITALQRIGCDRE